MSICKTKPGWKIEGEKKKTNKRNKNTSRRTKNVNKLFLKKIIPLKFLKINYFLTYGLKPTKLPSKSVTFQKAATKSPRITFCGQGTINCHNLE